MSKLRQKLEAKLNTKTVMHTASVYLDTEDFHYLKRGCHLRIEVRDASESGKCEFHFILENTAINRVTNDWQNVSAALGFAASHHPRYDDSGGVNFMTLLGTPVRLVPIVSCYATTKHYQLPNLQPSELQKFDYKFLLKTVRNMDQRQIAWVLRNAWQKVVTGGLPDGEMRKTFKQDMVEVKFESPLDQDDYCANALRQSRAATQHMYRFARFHDLLIQYDLYENQPHCVLGSDFEMV